MRPVAQHRGFAWRQLDIVAGNAIKISGGDLAAAQNMTLDWRGVTIDPGQDDAISW